MDRETEKNMVLLAFLSYVGFAEIGVKGDSHIREMLVEALDELPRLKDQWQLVWGPVSVRFPWTVFAENMAFIVRKRRSADVAAADLLDEYVLVIRGTNPVSVSNWLVEDFSVMRQTDWPYAHDIEGPKPKISMGTLIGLNAIQQMIPQEGFPGAGRSIYDFLASQAASSTKRIRLNVTGHSLGGALSPAVGLWLEDTRGVSDRPESSAPWDPSGKAEIVVYSFAGPSPGNQAFARYYDAHESMETHRIWNSLDVVPHGWELSLLKKLDELYSPHIWLDPVMGLVFRLTRHIARNGDYKHIRYEAPPLDGSSISHYFESYFPQMLWQHSVAYLELYELLGNLQMAAHLPFPPWLQSAFEEAERSAAGAVKSAYTLETSFRRRRPPSLRGLGAALRGLTGLFRIPASYLVHMLPDHLPLGSLMERGGHHRRRSQNAPATAPVSRSSGLEPQAQYS